MERVLNKAYRELTRLMIHLTARYYDLRGYDPFSGVQTYCLFIGYPRSGHSLVGSLLDAHRHAVIAHEQDALRFIHAGWGRRRLYNLLVANSRVFALFGRRWRGFTYRVPNQWQGRFERIQVIGDKKGGKTTRRLQTNPGILDRLDRVVGVETKFLHIVRNPYDNISTISIKHRFDLQRSIDFYFSLCQTVMAVRACVAPGRFLDMRQETITESPEASIRTLCEFLGLDTPETYLHDCAGIVYSSPHRSRNRIQWDGEAIGTVADRMKSFPFLEGYTFYA